MIEAAELVLLADLEALLPLRTIAEGNVREHWASRARRVEGQRSHARALVGPSWFRLLEAIGAERVGVRKRRALPADVELAILLHRYAPSTGLDPHDGLPSSQKAIVDGLSDLFGFASDRDHRLRWSYDQSDSRRCVFVERERRLLVAGYGVRVRVEARRSKVVAQGAAVCDGARHGSTDGSGSDDRVSGAK